MSHSEQKLVLSFAPPKGNDVEKTAQEISALTKDLNALHIAYGGNGLRIESWDVEESANKIYLVEE